MLREEFGIGVDSKSVELGVHTKGRDNRELNIEPLKFDQSTNESLRIGLLVLSWNKSY